jgi:ribonuclease G
VSAGQVLQLRIEEPHASNAADGIARVDGYVIDVADAGRLVGQVVPVEIMKVFRTYAKGRVAPH